MHQQWDPVMLEEYLLTDAAISGGAVLTQASEARRAVLSNSVIKRRPTSDVRQTQPNVDLTFG